MSIIRLAKIFWDRFKKPEPVLGEFSQVFERLQTILKHHQKVMDLMADLAEKSGGEYVFDRKYLEDVVQEIHMSLLSMVQELNFISSNKYTKLYTILEVIISQLEAELRGRLGLSHEMPFTVTLDKAPSDRPELIGGKANVLVTISRNLQLPIPPNGLVITTKAYRLYLETNELEERIYALLDLWAAGEKDEHKISRQIRYHILSGIVPREISKAIEQWVSKGKTKWAVRSSAYGEDGELSFAGIHDSVLNVPSHEVLRSYKKVLASLYSPEALVYRREMNMLGEEAAMAVIIQEMVQSKVSGVIHTVDISSNDPNNLVIFASWGLGRTVVEGRGTVDRFVVGRDPPHNIIKKEIAVKTTSIEAQKEGGEREYAVKPEEQTRATLSEDDIAQLAKWAIAIERYFKHPQEIEWAIDHAGNYVILQSRKLFLPASESEYTCNITTVQDQYTVLMDKVGTVVHAGVGSGPVVRVFSDADMEKFAEGSVLVTKYTAPWLARIVPKASAIIAERGSPAGHLATIAREFRVPTLVGVNEALEKLSDGQVITVDTKSRTIYAGTVKELISYELFRSQVFEDTPEFRLLRRLLRRITPLHLTDPSSPDFTPEGCQSVHDVVRFVHEKAIEELMDVEGLLRRSKGFKVYTLQSEIPIGLRVLDLGNGIDPLKSLETDKIKPNDILSVPFKAFWNGLSEPGVWNIDPVVVDFKGMMSSLTRTWSDTTMSTSATEFNLAIISENYMNLHLRLGYHFNLIDARVEPFSPHNYIYFRFVGGVTDITRRSRRAQLLSAILSAYHFKVDVKEDLVVGKVLHLTEEEMTERLKMLGRLVGFTRQLDVKLQNDEDVSSFVRAFYELNPH